MGLCKMWEEMEIDRPFTFQNYFRGVLNQKSLWSKTPPLDGCRPLARAKACIHLFKSHLLLLGSAWCFSFRRYRVFLFLGGTAYCLQGHVGSDEMMVLKGSKWSIFKLKRFESHFITSCFEMN